MGSPIIFNDTLQITTEQGFPKELELAKHLQKNFTAEDFAGKVLEFRKPEMRLYHPAPTPVSLVQNINGKWIYWGRALILEQTINAEMQTTSGKYRISVIYNTDLMKLRSKSDTDPDKLYTFPE